jgi:hypothetical protein
LKNIPLKIYHPSYKATLLKGSPLIKTHFTWTKIVKYYKIVLLKVVSYHWIQWWSPMRQGVIACFVDIGDHHCIQWYETRGDYLFCWYWWPSIKMTTTYDFGNAGPGFVHAHIFYVRLLSWNWCPSSLSDSACRTSRLRIAMFYWEKKYYFDRCLPMGCRTSKESVIQKLKLFIQLCEKKQYYLHNLEVRQAESERLDGHQFQLSNRT